MRAVGFKCGTVYRKPEKCKNKIFINEKYLNQIVIEIVKKRLEQIEINKLANKVTDYYRKNNEEMKKLKKCRNEIERLERKKSVLYKKKCENYITIEKFKQEYERAKEEIANYKKKSIELEEKNKSTLDEKKIKEIVEELKKGTAFTNEILKQIINKIEVYSNLKIEITFNI